MIHFFLIGFILLIIYLFSNALKAREIALYATQQHCQKLKLQLLDECVALTAFWIKRNDHGHYQGWRSYTFEFSATGLERCEGRLIMLGSTIISITLDPYPEA
jgi:hypothetical protein